MGAAAAKMQAEAVWGRKRKIVIVGGSFAGKMMT